MFIKKENSIARQKIKQIKLKWLIFVALVVLAVTSQGGGSIFNLNTSQAKAGSETARGVNGADPLSAYIRALWVFSASVIPDSAARVRLVEHSAQSGITDLYASLYQPIVNSSGRRMFEEDKIADLVSRAHLKNQKVWAAYGAPDWADLGCASNSFPMQRMAEVVAYNNSRTAAEKLDGVVLDVEPEGASADINFQALLSLYQCVRDFLPPEIKLAVAIRFSWDTPVAFPAAGGAVKPAYRHIIDLDLDNVIVMGYRDFAGTTDCAQGDGVICVDQDEINYATAVNKAGQVLVGLETLDPVIGGISDKETFFEEGQLRMSWVLHEAVNHFSGSAGFGGSAIHNYNSAYLSGLSGWESPVTSSVAFYAHFDANADAAYVTGGNIRTSGFRVTRSGADWGARIHPSFFRLQLTNDTDAVNTANQAGWVFAGIPTSNFASPYNPTLGSNSGKITWSFNMRQVRDNPAGFDADTYGVAFILGTTSENAAAEGSGYAVVLGQTGAVDPIRLVKFTGGLRGTMTNLIVSNTEGLTDFGPEYLSIRVTFNPAINQWELFLRNDGTTDFAEPSVGSLVSQGTAADSDYTGIDLPYLGGYWQGATQQQQTAFFDNIAVSITPPLAPTAADASLGGRVTIAGGRAVSDALVMLSGGALPAPVFTKTNPFGYYRFHNLPVGQTYVVTVTSKRSVIGGVAQAVTLLDEVTNFDFVIPAR